MLLRSDGDDVSGRTAMEASPFDRLPAELLQDILSRLDWKQQLIVKEVSRRWRAAVDACVVHRKELDINMRKRYSKRDELSTFSKVCPTCGG